MAITKCYRKIKTLGTIPYESQLAPSPLASLLADARSSLFWFAELGNRIAKFHSRAENEFMFKEGQRVRANLAGMQAGGVLFHAAVTDAVGNVVRQTSENPPVYLVRLLFSFKGVNEVEVPADRITAF